MRTLLAGVAGGLLLFIWGGVSHAVLDWYAAPFHEFADDSVVLESIEREAPRSGLYYIPHDYDHRADSMNVFMNVVTADRQQGFGMQMATGVVLHIVSALLVIMLLRAGLPRDYWRRVGAFTAAGTVIAFVVHAYFWNWFGFPTSYFLLSVADAAIGWTLAGLAIAALLRPTR